MELEKKNEQKMNFAKKDGESTNEHDEHGRLSMRNWESSQSSSKTGQIWGISSTDLQISSTSIGNALEPLLRNVAQQPI